jgi:hypothetical protein
MTRLRRAILIIYLLVTIPLALAAAYPGYVALRELSRTMSWWEWLVPLRTEYRLLGQAEISWAGKYVMLCRTVFFAVMFLIVKIRFPVMFALTEILLAIALAWITLSQEMTGNRGINTILLVASTWGIINGLNDLIEASRPVLRAWLERPADSTTNSPVS